MATLPLDDNRDGITLTGASDTLPKEYLLKAPQIETLRKRFDDARDQLAEARDNSLRDRDYFDGPKQLNSDVRQTLSLRSQPAIYTNRVRPAVNGILGILEASRSDPRGFPRNPQDEASADVCTKTLRFIADTAKFDETKQDVAENFLIEGTGAAIVEMDGEDIAITHIRHEEFYHDPYSRRADFRDARYMGVAKWKDAAEVRQKWADRINEIGDPLSGSRFFGILGSSFEDRPEGRGWIDRKRHRVMLVEEYAVVGGVWHRIVYVATGVLEYAVSPYLDDKGRPTNPIEAVSCYVASGTVGQLGGMSQNDRYGIVRDMVPIQDEVNASRSRSLHLMNSRQVQKVDMAAPPIDEVTVRQEAAKADGVIPPGYQIVTTAEQTQANLLRMQEAKGEIERMGPTPAVLGRSEGGSQSGRARLVLQQAGMTELARPLARLKDWELRCYRAMWCRARQFKQQPWWIRVTDELRTPEFLQVNEPVIGPVVQEMGVDELGQPVMGVAEGVVGFNNRLADLDMDIILDTTPDTTALQQEVFAELTDIIARTGLSPFSPEFEVILEMSPLTDKVRVLERLKAKREEMQQAQAQAAQAEQEAAQRAQQIAVDKAVADTEKTQAQTAEIEVDTMTKAFRAGQDSLPAETGA